MNAPTCPEVLVFGEALFDDFGDVRVAGGAPYNLARHLAGLGAAPLLVTRIGDDAGGRELLGEMGQRGLRTEAVQTDATAPTGRVRVLQDAGGHRFVIEPDAAWDAIGAPPDLLALACDVPWMYFGTLALRGADSHAAWRALCQAHRGRRFLDLNWRDGHVAPERAREALARSDVVKLSEDELSMVLDWHGLPHPGPVAPPAPGAICAPLASLLAPYAVRTLVVTFGGAGYAAFDRHGRCLQAGPAQPGVAVVDTVGAGDAFASVVLLGLCRGWDMGPALARANAFAAAICGLRGAVPQDLQAYHPWRQRWGLD